MSELSKTADNLHTIHKHWKNLSVIIQCSPLLSNSLLKQAAPASAPPLSFIRQLVKICISSQQIQLFHRHLFSASVLFKDKNNQQEELQQLCQIGKIFSDILSNTINDASWIAVPLAVVREQKAVNVTKFFHVGQGTEFFFAFFQRKSFCPRFKSTEK